MTEDDLYYYGTDIKICVGDRVLYPKFFKKLLGTVVYVPGQSPINKDMEYGDVRQWGIKLDNRPNDIILLGYFPPDEVIPKNLKFVERGNVKDELKPYEKIL